MGGIGMGPSLECRRRNVESVLPDHLFGRPESQKSTREIQGGPQMGFLKKTTAEIAAKERKDRKERD